MLSQSFHRHYNNNINAILLVIRIYFNKIRKKTRGSAIDKFLNFGMAIENMKSFFKSEVMTDFGGM